MYTYGTKARLGEQPLNVSVSGKHKSNSGMEIGQCENLWNRGGGVECVCVCVWGGGRRKSWPVY